jgi:hypothetical protein
MLKRRASILLRGVRKKPRSGVIVVGLSLMLAGCSVSYVGRGVDTQPVGGQSPAVGVNVGTPGAFNLLAGVFLFNWFAALIFSETHAEAPPPPGTMAEDRVINEQDCTEPIKRPQANLRCR